MITPKKAIILIIVLGCLAYFNSLFNGFVWDDEEQIVNNAIIQNLSNLPQILTGATFSTGGAGLSGWFFRPLLSFSYMLNYAIWGQNALGFHLFQVSFHIANAILLFLILQRLSGSKKNNSHLMANTILSSIFVVHPAIVEAVSYIAAVSEVMYTFFNLLGLLIFLRTNQDKPRLKQILMVSLFFFLGLLFKEASIVIFPIMVIYLLLYHRSDWKHWTVSFAATIALYFFTRLFVAGVPIQHPQFAPISEASLVERILTIPAELFAYLKIIFYPNRLAISQHFVVTQPAFSIFIIPLVAVLVFFGALFILAYQQRSRLLFWGLCWFLTGFALVSNIFPLDMTMAERWLYFSMIGMILIAAGFLHWLSISRIRVFQIAQTILIFAIPILLIKTIARNTNWYNGLTLYNHDIQISQNSFDLENNLGVELFRIGEYDEAKLHFERSIKLQPKWHFAYNNLGAVYEREKDYDRAKEFYQKTLQVSDYYLAYENLAGILVFHYNAKDGKEFTQNALKKLPNNSRLWFILAIAQYKLGDRQEALTAAKNSYYLLPSEQAAYVISHLEQNQPISPLDQ